jgi:hypothetical protein
MATRQHPTTFFKGDMQPLKGAQPDYSYNQWRHAQMRELEGEYVAQCERDRRSMARFA